MLVHMQLFVLHTHVRVLSNEDLGLGDKLQFINCSNWINMTRHCWLTIPPPKVSFGEDWEHCIIMYMRDSSSKIAEISDLGNAFPYLKVIGKFHVIDPSLWHFHIQLGLYVMPNSIDLIDPFFLQKKRGLSISHLVHEIIG